MGIISVVSAGTTETAFLANQLAVPSESVEAILVFSRLINPETRSAMLKTIKTNEGLKRTLQKLKINHEEFIAIIRLLYHDFNIHDLSEMIKPLNLHVNSHFLKGLLGFTYFRDINHNEAENAETIKEFEHVVEPFLK